jgi:hypothetical protein
LTASYTDDERFRARFQAWVRDMWAQKDALIDELLAEGTAGAIEEQRIAAGG